MERESSRPRILSNLLAWVAGVACLFPPFYMLLQSVAGRWSFPGLLPESLEPERWASVWRQDVGLPESLAVSIAISAMVASVSSAVGFLAGRHVAYHPRRDSLMLLAYLPFAMSPVIAGVCLLFVYLRLGLSGGVAGVVAAQLIFALGFAIVFFQGFWTAERRALEDLARTLGADNAGLYLKVLLPVARPMLMLCFFQTFLLSWFQYGLTLLIGSGKVRTLPLKVYDYLGEANVAYAALGACLLVAPAVAMLWAGRWMLARRDGDVS